MSVDLVAGVGVSVTVATCTGAEILAAGDALKARGARLAGQAGISGRASGNEQYGYNHTAVPSGFTEIS